MERPKDGAQRDLFAALGLVAYGLVVAAGCGGIRSEVSAVPARGVPLRLGSLDTDGDGSPELLTFTAEEAAVGVHDIDPATLAWTSSAAELHAIPGATAVCRGSTAPTLALAFPTLGTVELAELEGETCHSTLVLGDVHESVGLACADVDADGRLDVIVVIDGPQPELRVIHQATAGSFAAAKWLPVGPTSRSVPRIWTGDIDSTGRVAVAFGMLTGRFDDPVPDQVRVFRNAAHGDLVDETWYRVRSPSHVAGGRVGNDDSIDLVAFGRFGAWLLPGSEHGWFGRPRRVVAGRFASGLVADIDHDGRDDIIGLEADRNRVTVVRSVGPDRFAPRMRFEVGDGATDVVALGYGQTTLLVTANAQSRDYTTIKLRTGP